MIAEKRKLFFSFLSSSLVHLLLTALINTSVTADIIKFAVDTCAFAYLDAL